MTVFLPRPTWLFSPVFLLAALALTACTPSVSLAQDDASGAAAQTTETAEDEADPGQAQLDEAAVLRFDAQSMRDLSAVENLLKSAIKKGLSGENLSFAKKMLGSVYMQEGQQIIER